MAGTFLTAKDTFMHMIRKALHSSVVTVLVTHPK